MNSGNLLSPSDYKEQNSNLLGESMDLEMTPDLAEVCGIHAGDGYLRGPGRRAELDISGGVDEKDYYDNHVVPLFERVFNLKIEPRFFPYRRTYGFVIRDRSIIEFMHSLGFPYGKKTLTVSVPQQVLQSDSFSIIYHFIRGLFDTDGCLSFRKRGGSGYKKFYLKRHTYPVITFGTCSKPLWKDVGTLLMKTGFQFAVSYGRRTGNEHQAYSIALSGDQNMLTWINNIGFKNPLKLNRFLIWKNFGFVPSELSYAEQIKILEGACNPDHYYSDRLSKEDNLAPLLVKRRIKRMQDLEVFIPKT